MQPFYFGTSQKQLFGVYHAAEAGSSKRPGVVMCYPMGHEYLRAHRAFRNLAATLAAQGFHVLRFDYYGTGDSAGDGAEATVEQCLSDTAAAVDELKDIAGSSSVSLLGLRLGGAIATMAATGRRDIDQVLLWDPVLDGSAYVAETFALQRQWLEDRLGSRATIDEEPQLVGFPLTSGIRSGLEAIRPVAASSLRAKSVSLFVSEDVEGFRALYRDLTAAKTAGTYAVVPGSGDWRNGEVVHDILLPHAMLRTITSALCS
jgi:pimeloyl-ACP methyl ester carboxylesterase